MSQMYRELIIVLSHSISAHCQYHIAKLEKPTHFYTFRLACLSVTGALYLSRFYSKGNTVWHKQFSYQDQNFFGNDNVWDAM